MSFIVRALDSLEIRVKRRLAKLASLLPGAPAPRPPIKTTGLALGATREVPREEFFLKEKLAWMGDTAQIGDHSYGDLTVVMGNEGKRLRVGRFCSVASGCKVFLGQYHRSDWVTTYPFTALPEEFPEVAQVPGHPYSPGDVTIGNDVWIGTDVTILAGITIGDGAIIGTQSLVTKSVEPYAVVGGNPARTLRRRFDDATVAKLLEIRWWDWPEAKLRRYLPYLVSDDIQALFAAWERESASGG